MSLNYANPALDAELAYRREVLMAAGRGRTAAAAPGSAAVAAPADPARRVTSGSVLSEVRATIDAVPRWDDAPIVGRADELARLMAHVDRAVAGRSSAVLLAGDAGVGKTRLLDELTARAAERGVRVLTGHCVDLGDVGLPYLPFVDLLRPVAGEPDLAPVSSANPALAGLLAGRAGGLPPVPPPSEGSDLSRPLPNRAAPQPVDDGRLQLFESVAGLICEVAAAGPLLIVLEDVHWADRSSRDLLRYLLARLVDEPVTVVASYRADDLHRRHPLRPLLAELVRLPGVERIELAPLPDAEVGVLVRGLAASTGGLPESIVDDVVARAEGNAFYAEELLAAGLHGEALPLGLTDVLLARVEQRSPEAQQVLRIAAVAGRRVRHELVAAVGGLTTGDLEQALAETVHHHLLVVSDDGRYRFRHALLREAVLADLLPGERVRLHSSIAAYLADNPGAGTSAERAHHARESNDLPRRLQRLPRGGGGGLFGRGARRTAAAPGGGPRPLAGGARRGRAGRPRPGGAAARDRGRRAHRGGAAPRRRAAAGGAGPARARRRPGGAGARALHARPGHGPGRGRRRSPPRERRGDGARARGPAVGGAHLGGGHARADELLPRPDGRSRRRGRRGAGRGRRPRTRQRVVGHRGLPGAGAGGPGPRGCAAPAGRGAAAGPPFGRRRRGDAGPVQPGQCGVRGRPGGRDGRAGRGGRPGARTTSASSGRSTRPSCGICRSRRCTWPATGTRAWPRPTCWPGCRRWPRTCGRPGCWSRSGGETRLRAPAWTGRGR